MRGVPAAGCSSGSRLPVPRLLRPVRRRWFSYFLRYGAAATGANFRITAEFVLAVTDALFSSPCFRFELPDAAALNARLLPAIAARRALGGGLARSNQHGWHSDDQLFRWPEAPFQELCRGIGQAIFVATRQVAPGYEFSGRGLQAEGWVNVNGQHAYNTPHDHAGWAWSGCYYVQVPAGSGRSSWFEFPDTRTNANVVGIQGAACFASKVPVQPRAGVLLLFPSYLPHWV